MGYTAPSRDGNNTDKHHSSESSRTMKIMFQRRTPQSKTYNKTDDKTDDYQLEINRATNEISLKSKFTVKYDGKNGNVFSVEYISKEIHEGAKGKVYEVTQIDEPENTFVIKIPKYKNVYLKEEREKVKEVYNDLFIAIRDTKIAKGKPFVEGKIHMVKPLSLFDSLALPNGQKIEVILFERLKGKDLHDYIYSSDKDPYLTTHDLLRKTSKAISDYNKKYSHRDIKFENIFITEKGEIKIIDCGDSIKIGKEYSNDTGTPQYCSSKLLAKDTQFSTPERDTYAFGCLMFELLFSAYYFPDNIRFQDQIMIAQELNDYRIRELNEMIENNKDNDKLNENGFLEYCAICKDILEENKYKDLEAVRQDFKAMKHPDKGRVEDSKYYGILPQKTFEPSLKLDY